MGFQNLSNAEFQGICENGITCSYCTQHSILILFKYCFILICLQISSQLKYDQLIMNYELRLHPFVFFICLYLLSYYGYGM